MRKVVVLGISGARSMSVRCLAGRRVGVKQVGDHIWLVTFMDYDQGYFDDETCRLEPIDDPFGAKCYPCARNKSLPIDRNRPGKLEAPPGFEPGMEVLQTSALPLGDGAAWIVDAGMLRRSTGVALRHRSDLRYAQSCSLQDIRLSWPAMSGTRSPKAERKIGAGNGIRTRDFDLGKVALYH